MIELLGLLEILFDREMLQMESIRARRMESDVKRNGSCSGMLALLMRDLEM